MANLTRNFVAGKMNKTFDERVVPAGEYIDALNIRMGSTENSEVGAIENTLGNLPLTTLMYQGVELSSDARCIGAYQDGANETIYWFVHDPSFPLGPTGKIDMLVSVNVLTSTLTYHLISMFDGLTDKTTLNFNPTYTITGVDKVDNLLFFTDDYNPPRFINVKRSYATPNGSYVDYAGDPYLFAEALQVVKKPPYSSPTVTPYIVPGEEQFMVDRFISFAYRYRYADNEYSATSQWSDIAFVPKPFDLSLDSFLNDGMTNAFNAVTIEYNTGGPLVVGIDLLFKEANSNVIKVIEKLNKAELGLPDGSIQTYQFSNSKIFTILPQSEILRLYDNVPRFAKAQTVMGNRLMYGNYVEGYNLIDYNGNPTRFTYYTDLITEDVGFSVLKTYSIDGNYDFRGLPNTINNSITIVELADQDLVEGSILNVTLTIKHNSFDGDTPFPSDTTQNTDITFSFYLPVTYASVYDMVTSTQFVDAVGTAANIQPIYTPIPGPTSCDGNTWTDIFNCAIPNNLNSLFKYASGITGWLNQPIAIYCAPGDTFFQIQLPAMLFIDAYPGTSQEVVEYYRVISSEASFQVLGNSRSLHSNRGYEIGIVYMDEFNRASTALVSPNNAVHVSCGLSANKNSIQVTIPVTQKAPYWAKRYKFVIKPDEENYDTIYCNLFFNDPETNNTWFYLEGENTKKVEVGDRFIVKSDTDGPRKNCAYATVLDKQAQPDGFISPAGGITVPAGLYVKINPNSFAAVLDPESIINLGEQRDCASPGGNFKVMPYLVNIERTAGFDPLHPTWVYEDYSIPAGSIINLYFDWERGGVGGKCERRGYTFDRRLTVSANYDNFQDWWNGDNVAAILNTGVQKDGETELQYIPTNGVLGTVDFSTMFLQFYTNPVTNQTVLQFSTGRSCTGRGYRYSRQYCVTVRIEVFRANDLIIFETEPQDALPDVFFENNLSFGIDEDGNHLGNVQDQDIATNTPGIVNTEFFNCFSFGNGAESYKIRDSIIGRTFNFGERVTTISEQNYEEVDRFSDITYSGNFNRESNVNRLNEFNKGLSNYKNCEASFGEIFILDGRETNVLVLQEDKISYVLAEKNLLSDSAGGGVVTSVPEVLGTQIARIEKYGISFNPESYVQWGYDRFFTDVKRGAVIQLKGDSGPSEELVAISNQSMRTWFRDTFNQSFNTQKLGGFDPYMNEYVLSTNDILLPVTVDCLNCGINQTFTLSVGEAAFNQTSYCVDLGPLVGDTNVNWTFSTIEEGATLNIDVIYDGVTVSSGPVDVNGTLMFSKNNVSVETVEIILTYTGDMIVSILAECCQSEELNIVEVVLTNNSEAGQTIHTQYRYTDGTFVGPLLSNLVLFASGTGTPLVSRYNITTGLVGSGGFPPELSTMRLSTNKIVPDTYNFDITQNKFKYLRSSTLYNNNNVDIETLLAASSIATPNAGSSPLFYADFTVPASSNGNYLYLIWDLRSAILTELCFSETNVQSCCECTLDDYYLNASFEDATSIFTDSDMTIFAANGFYSSNGIVRELVDGLLLPAQICDPCAVEVNLCFGSTAIDVCCFCDNTCDTPYNTYLVSNPTESAVLIGYYNEEGIFQEDSLPAGSEDVQYCSIGSPTCIDPAVIIVFDSCGCGIL